MGKLGRLQVLSGDGSVWIRRLGVGEARGAKCLPSCTKPLNGLFKDAVNEVLIVLRELRIWSGRMPLQ
ncbi:12-oxophytodienoate reductase [Pseudomonas sp. TCU-HL1]|nr:12-oxophytodienoate reductase [Pseudomonas sp. TCU-HL1]